jgi:hypothetical protein
MSNFKTFRWYTPDKIPTNLKRPILCVTRNNKLCVFRYENDKWVERWSWLRYKTFEKVAQHYGIKYWVYQDELLLD